MPSQKGFAQLLLIIILLAGIVVAVYLTQFAQVFKPKAAETTSLATDIEKIRSVTYFIEHQNNPSLIHQRLVNDLPKIKANGFNTILIVSGWSHFNPKPLANPPVYNAQAFMDMKAVLALLKDNNMKAIIPLNYFEGGAPEGILVPRPGSPSRCDWLVDPVKFNSFITFTTEYLNQISEYSDMVYPMVFSENSECNVANYNWTDLAKRKELNQVLRNSLGNTPARLPLALRSKFKFGYYDAALVRHMVQAGITNDTPIAVPNPFDFLSTGGYYAEGEHSDQEINQSINTAINEFRQSFPSQPLLIFELGQATCPNTKRYSGLTVEANQSRVLAAQVKLLTSLKLGFNIWAWQDTPYTGDCPLFGGTTVINEGYGLGLNYKDGLPKPALQTIKQLIFEDKLPVGAEGGSNCTQLIGWACDPNDFNQTLDVHFYQDGPAYGASPGKLVASTKANLTVNNAVSQYCGGKTAKWFRMETPAVLKDGKPHTLHIYPINYPHSPGKQNTQINNSPVSLNCAPPTPSPSVTSPAKPGDVDRDGDVDIFDFNIVISNFDKTGTGIPGDLDNNNKVDIFDYNIVLGNFGR